METRPLSGSRLDALKAAKARLAAKALAKKPKKPKLDEPEPAEPAPQIVGTPEWKDAVREARTHVQAMNRARMEVAAIAIRVCRIERRVRRRYPGGGVHPYLKRFAEEINVSYQTLWDWVTVKLEVVDRLPPGQYDEDRYTVALKTRRKVVGECSAEEVRKAYRSELDLDPVEKSFGHHLGRLEAIQRFVAGLNERTLGKRVHLVDDLERGAEEILRRIKQFRKRAK